MSVPHSVNCYLTDNVDELCAVCLSRAIVDNAQSDPATPGVMRPTGHKPGQFNA